MIHSINIIADYVCKYYGVTRDQLSSGDRHWPIMKTRQAIILICGMNRDEQIAELLKIKRSTVRYNRRVARGYLDVGVIKKSEIDELKQGLLKYEISKT